MSTPPDPHVGDPGASAARPEGSAEVPAPDRPYGPPRLAPAPDWAGGAAAVTMLCFDVDAESPILAEDPALVRDLSTMSHQAYGPLVGVPRILDLLARHEVPGTFFVPGVVAERWPGTVRAILDAGHEVALHGHDHLPLVQRDAAAQREDLLRAREALDRAGAEPRGYRAPYWRQTQETLELLAEAGLAYDSSLMDDDRPYVLDVGGARLAELPVHWSLDDWEQYAFLPEPDVGQRIVAPSTALRLWTEELDAMRATGGLCALTAHPFLSGRPSRIAALDAFVRHALDHGDVAFARGDALAARVLGGASAVG